VSAEFCRRGEAQQKVCRDPDRHEAAEEQQLADRLLVAVKGMPKVRYRPCRASKTAMSVGIMECVVLEQRKPEGIMVNNMRRCQQNVYGDEW